MVGAQFGGLMDWVKRAFGRLAAAGLAVACLSGASAVAAPSTKVGTALLVSPSGADTFYGGATTSTNSTGAAVRPNEIKELVRALKSDPDLIYEYVRNTSDTVWSYGLTKGAMGVLVDHAGTAFDQANLMVELLREAGFTASYKVGYLTLTGAQFADWSGVTSATAACQLLSSGGIPGAVNGSSTADCNYGSATVTTIDVGHVWVAVTISGVEYVFDPAYKAYSFKAGVNLATAAGLTSGEALTAASTGASDGTDSGVGYSRWLNKSSLDTKISTYAASLQTSVQAMSSATSLSDVIGGAERSTYTSPANGLRQISLPYTATVLRTISGNVPNQYRTALGVQLTKLRPDTSTPTIISKTLYLDETYGRRLTFDTNFDTTGASFTGELKLVDDDGSALSLQTASYADSPEYSKGVLTLTLNTPYAAAADRAATVNGSYMDVVVSRPVSYALPFLIVQGAGVTSRDLIAKWGARKDTAMPATPDYGCPLCFRNYKATTKGDGRRETISASWLAQQSQAARIHAAIGKSLFLEHFAVGVAYADAQIIKTDRNGGSGSPNYAYWIGDSFDRLDVEAGISLTSKTATATDRRAALQAIAATMAALKGSTVGQVADLPDVGSTASRFAWGNAPTASEDVANGAARKFYRFTTSTEAGQASSLAVVDNATSTTDDGVQYFFSPAEIGSTEFSARRQTLANAVSSYVTNGFQVTASAEALLGPGSRAGAFRPDGSGAYTHGASNQRGGALVATRYDANGDPLEIAHILTGLDASGESGGGGVQIYHQYQYDPAVSAEVVRARFMDGRPGDTVVTSPVKIVQGKGSLPYTLTAEQSWRPSVAKDDVLGPVDHRQPQDGWTSNWSSNLTLSGSGLAVMREDDPRADLLTLATFLAVQDIYKASPGIRRDVAALLGLASWTDGLTGNVATVSLGLSTRQFVKTINNLWMQPGAVDYATLTQTGDRTISRRHAYCAGSDQATYVATRGWQNDDITFEVRNGGGDKLNFSAWRISLSDANAGCVEQQGYYLANWIWPTGYNITLSNQQTGGQGLLKLASVSSTFIGRTLNFSNGALGPVTASGSYQVLSPATPAADTTNHTDALGNVTQFKTATIGAGLFQRRVLEKVFAADNSALPASQITYDALGRTKETRDRLGVMGSRAPTQLLLASPYRAETIDALGYSSVVYSDALGRPARTRDALGQEVVTTYDGRGRVASVTSPEGDKRSFEYNDRNQPTQVTYLAKPSSSEVGQTLVTQTGWNAQWNKPAWSKDAKGAQTDFGYDGYGSLTSVTNPEATPGAGRTQGRLYYYPSGLTMSSVLPAGGTFSAGYDGSGYPDWNQRQSDLYDVASLSPDGDPTRIVSPLMGATLITYDNLRRPIAVAQPAVKSSQGDNRRVVTQTTYDALGRVTKVERGAGVSAGNTNAIYAPLGTFTALETSTTEFDAVGNVVKVVTPKGVVQSSYDALNRVTCTAVRMNAAVYSNLPTDACTPSTIGSQGPDRISRKVYDAAGRVIAEEVGVGTDAQQAAKRVTYTANGQVASLTDANGNRSNFNYDGFDRLKRLNYPAAPRGSGVASATDYEEYGYDLNGNRTSYRKRDGRVIAYQYNALNQMVVKDLPNTTTADVYYEYDANGRLYTARFGSATATPSVMMSWDGIGRRTDETLYVNGVGQTVNRNYDGDGNLSLLRWNNYRLNYAYDYADRLNGVALTDNLGPSNMPGNLLAPLLTINYGPLNRRSQVVRDNGVTTDYTFDDAGRLVGLRHSGQTPSSTFSQAFEQNLAGQLTKAAQTGSAFIWSGQPTTTTNLTHDQLNRNAAIAAASGYDANGNLISDGVRTFTYDVENRLTSVAGGAVPMSLDYDALGRLQTVTANGTATNFFYDGDKLIGEYAANNTTLLRWYAHGMGADEPLVWFEGSGYGARRWFETDRLGSIVGVSDISGNVTPYTYGPYGEPQSWAGSRFRYTGQVALPEAQLYYYKARVYDPGMGRFLQTDPIGYDDGLNIYAYVHGDPLNSTDPSGLSDKFTENVVCKDGCISDVTVNGERHRLGPGVVGTMLGGPGGTSGDGGVGTTVSELIVLAALNPKVGVNTTSVSSYQPTQERPFCKEAVMGQTVFIKTNGKLTLKPSGGGWISGDREPGPTVGSDSPSARGGNYRTGKVQSGGSNYYELPLDVLVGIVSMQGNPTPYQGGPITVYTLSPATTTVTVPFGEYAIKVGDAGPGTDGGATINVCGYY